MKKAVILHGICDEEEYFEMDFPSPSNAHWIPWLKQKFLRNGILCQALEMPTPYNPKYNEWKETFEQLNMKDISVIVGHSAGCGFILKWLNENKDIVIDKLVLVAPWMDPVKKKGNFLQFEIRNSLKNQVKELHVLYSKDEDVDGVLESKNTIIDEFETAKLHLFDNLGHFCFSDTGLEFKELWKIAKS